MRRVFVCALAGLLGSAACGGSGGPPPAAPGPAPAPANPCAVALADQAEHAPGASRSPDDSVKRHPLDGSSRWRVLDALWSHREAEMRAVPSLTSGAADAGEIALVADEGDLVLPPNAYDLANLGLRFSRNTSGGYDVRRVEGVFRPDLGAAVTLADDDSVDSGMPFAFPFYGTSQPRLYVNSDGNLTFEEADKSSTERNVARLLTGPPRVAAFLADLDPSKGGKVFVKAAADRVTVTWCGVRGFESDRTTTVQATLLPAGVIEMMYGPDITLGDAIVGLSPGRTGDFRPVNLSDAESGGGGGAVGERFARHPQLDVVAVSRKFYQAHPDGYDQLVVWTDQPFLVDAFATETTVKNDIRGIGVDTYDLAGNFGSAGRLQSLVMMDWIGKYPESPTQRFLGENNTVSLLGQEVGHRWLAFLEFRDRNGERSDALLGRDLAHWSFFLDSSGSVMEGNAIEDLGGGSFRTAGAVRRYSLLDQYAMGLVPESGVRPFFYVESPVNLSAERTRDSSPESGITFNGTRRDVLIQDIVAVHGPRQPTAAQSARVHRQAFVFVTTAGRTVDPAQVAHIDQIRRAWEPFFLEATDRRMAAVTSLR